ncbi:hypothetical protein HYH03_001076 [Edaphochlamys debaryana]|uniref:Heterokaryon incompatibility domain-containing protein n=1 Tax=Edaphochlamys debaryana TaxID=47281 RepID=A0A835YEA9_9CHLO|nr:hypothetical protein HYH03_001076 [Edaphochlamys debaryana]|eukprot:KAG2501270.1 hypothetical protein HYH03_001076 [Edaphochlamys debaryana]
MAAALVRDNGGTGTGTLQPAHSATPTSQDVAVLSYRWRIRGKQESIDDFRTWLHDCGQEGYEITELDGDEGDRDVDWSLANGHDIQIEVAAWLLWLYVNNVAQYVWVDQMCVPQDADLEVKMGHIKDSPAIYTAGKVYVLLAPVVDYASGRIMNAKDARAIVSKYKGEMDSYRGASFLSRSAVKCLLVNNSYMRRVWTIQEAVAARDLTVWPLMGTGEVNSYQSIYVVDWPEFNAWNGHPKLGPLYLKFDDAALNEYYEGDYTGLMRVLRDRPDDGIGYLAMAAKDLMWITMDRNGLVNDIKKADSAARRAWVVLNNHQIQSARSFLPEDRVLALVPLVDYPAWRRATQGVPARQLVQASVAWAYGVMAEGWERGELGDKRTWSLRLYNAPRCTARGLELLQPRRNLGNTTAIHGTTPDWEAQIPPAGGKLVLTAPPEHPDAGVTAALETLGALSAAPLELDVLASFLMPHPGQAKYWGEGPWKHVRDAIETDEVFRLSVQWALEPWRDPALGLDVERAAVVVVSGGSLPRPLAIVFGVHAGEDAPSRGQAMLAFEVARPLLDSLIESLGQQALGRLTQPLVAASAGVTPTAPPPPPPPEPEVVPEPTEPDWQVVSVRQPEEADGAAAAGPVDTGLAAPKEGTAITKGGEPGAVQYSGTEVAAGAGRAPVVDGEEGPCKGCVVC